MSLTIEFANLCRPPEDIKRLQHVFMDAMLNYCPDQNRLARWKQTRNWNYSRAYWYGYWAVLREFSEKEKKNVVPMVRFDND